jgi:hypothetical protein
MRSDYKTQILPETKAFPSLHHPKLDARPLIVHAEHDLEPGAEHVLVRDWGV